MSAENVIPWLRECFREDRSRRGVVDFFSSKVFHRTVLSGREELACGWLPEIVVSPAYAEAAAAHAALYRREKEVVYACLFLCGRLDGKWCRAPLLFYQGEFCEEAEAVFSIQMNRWRLNPRALEILQTDAEALTGILRGGELSEGTVGEIRDWAESLGVDAQALWRWPDLLDRAEVDDVLKNRTGSASSTSLTDLTSSQMRLLPVAAIGIVARSVSSRGVIDELDCLAEIGAGQWSKPLRIMLGVDPMKVVDFPHPSVFSAVPALLSLSQDRILESSRLNPVTLCHGPPGTGKSFTIAAIALNHVARGESVLVASHMDHAVDVVHEKIDTMIGGDEVTVRAGRQGYLSELKHFIEACLAGQMTANLPSSEQFDALFSRVKQTMSSLHADEKSMEDEWRDALGRGELMAKPDPRWWEKIQQAWVSSRVEKRPLLMELSSHLNNLYVQRERELGKYLRWKRNRLLDESLRKSGMRKNFKMMLNALKKYRGSEQEAIFQKMEIRSILTALPVWLVNLKDVHRVLPMEKELFDVAIIDESSQCDLASVLPILQRAKRVVIAGDAHQLNHLSFLSRLRQQALADELGVSEQERNRYDYSRVSLMDHASSVVENQSQVGFLNEHFRSSPRIIAFSNRKFYQDSLQVMRERPWEEEEQKSALVSCRCDGVRDACGVNEAEVKAVVHELERCLHETSGLPADQRLTLGVLSPFRNQVEAIREAVQKHFDSRSMGRLLKRHQLRIGTAYGFQGEERDVMLISFAVDARVGASTLRFVEREDVFNVSITRARSRQVVFHSLEADDLPRGSLLGDYLGSLELIDEEFSASAVSDHFGHSEHFDHFAQELTRVLRDRGVEVRLATRVAGVSVDLLLIDGDHVMGVDLIGYPGAMFEAVDRHRSKILRRAGFQLFPLGYAEWCAQKEHAVEVMMEMLRARAK